MKLLQELISERYQADDSYDAHNQWDPRDDATGGTGSFTIKEYDGIQPDDAIVSLFDIDVIYTAEDLGYTDHPYGETVAREEHGVEVEITSAVTAEEVTYRDPDTDEIVQTFPVGTDVSDLPGWNDNDNDYIQEKAEEHAVS